MLETLFHKLGHVVDLSPEDRRSIEARPWKFETLASHRELARDGDEPRHVHLILEGWACRLKQLEDGRRQIIALFVPGDMCDPCVFLLDRMSHALVSLTPVRVARLPERDMLALLDESSALSKAFWLEMILSAEVQREWTVSLGRRTAIERMAHLFCELLVRLRAVGLADAGSYDMPIKQADLGDLLGLSSVHVNRVLQEIRSMKLVELRGKRLVVLDEAALQALALFDPTYLHLQHSR